MTDREFVYQTITNSPTSWNYREDFDAFLEITPDSVIDRERDTVDVPDEVCTYLRTFGTGEMEVVFDVHHVGEVVGEYREASWTGPAEYPEYEGTATMLSATLHAPDGERYAVPQDIANELWACYRHLFE